MANGGTAAPHRGWTQQAHIDLGALSERVEQTQRQFQGLSTQVGDLQRDTASQFGSLRESIGAQFREFSARSDAQAAAFTASRTTNWTSFWATIATGVAVMVALGAAVLSPITGDLKQAATDLRELEKTAVPKDDFNKSIDLQQRRNLEGDAERGKIKDELEASRSELTRELGAARIELAKLEGASTERHETYLRDHAALAARVDAIDASLIKRPEIEAAQLSQRELTTLTNAASNARIDAVIASLNELRHDVGATYTWGDGLKHALDRVDTIQQEVNTLAQTLGRTALPAPAVPPR